MSGTAKHYISLFTGAGGLDIGFNEAGFHGLLASDIMPQAKETFILNYPDEPYLLEDIRTLSISEIKKYVGDKKVSVIIGGPPCQGFSNMGNKNSADPRNMLFESYVKIVDAIRPTCFLFENVKGLRTMFEGRYFKKVIEGFLAIGYNLHYALVDTSNYGVPQKRERIIIFGTMLDKQFLFPVFNADSFGRITAYKNVGEAINDLTDKGEEVPNHIALNHSDIVVRRYELIPEGGKLPKPEFLPEDIRRKNFGNTYTRLSRNEVSSTIVPGNNALPVHPTFIKEVLTTGHHLDVLLDFDQMRRRMPTAPISNLLSSMEADYATRGFIKTNPGRVAGTTSTVGFLKYEQILWKNIGLMDADHNVQWRRITEVCSLPDLL